MDNWKTLSKVFLIEFTHCENNLYFCRDDSISAVLCHQHSLSRIAFKLPQSTCLLYTPSVDYYQC